MISFDTFHKYLSNTVKLREVKFTHIGEKAEKIDEWITTLSVLELDKQCNVIEKTLSEFITSDIDDEKRLELTNKTLNPINRVVSQLHSYYLNEADNFSEQQQGYCNQVKSLYYLAVLAYSGIVSRQLTTIKNSNPNALTKMLPSSTVPMKCLHVASFQLLRLYKKLMMESAIEIKPADPVFWQQVNKLYFIGLKYQLTDEKVSKEVTQSANSLYDVYRQICLYSLLKPFSYRRQDITGIHKLLFVWSQKISLSHLIKNKTNIFVHLQQAHAPEYLTPFTKINPFDDKNLCVFVDIKQLADYLYQVHTSDDNKASFERRLARLSYITLQQQQYVEREEDRVSVDKTISIAVGLHRMHYYLSGRKTLYQLIEADTLSSIYRPQKRSLVNEEDVKVKQQVNILDKSNSGYRLSYDVNVYDKEVSAQQNNLKMLSVFSIVPDRNNPDVPWQMVIIRWLNLSNDSLEAGCKVMGSNATACGVRLESKDDRSQDFVMAILMSGDDALGTNSSLILPHYHFKSGDKVMLRIGTKETLLRLAKCTLETDDIEQFEILKSS